MLVKTSKAKKTTTTKTQAQVLFAPAAIQRLEAQASLPAKFLRMLGQYDMKKICGDGTVAIKIHVGGGYGFTTIPPLFLRLLVEKVKEAGAKSIFLTDGSGSMPGATARGYTAEVLGAPLLGAAGIRDKFFYKHKVGYRTLKEVEICGNIEDADVLLNVSHFKGHGACGYGAASKNLAMGCVTGRTRGDLHRLEGGLEWDAKKCIKCKKCVEACNRGAARWDDKEDQLKIFYHHCAYCRHCVLACPKKAFKINGGGFVPFQRGLALATREVLRTFDPARVLHINFLMQMTVYCDCWGFSSPSLIPDVGILASPDIVAADKASLDMTRDGTPLPGSLPPGRELMQGDHLFEKIHGKDPYEMVRQMQEVGLGNDNYAVKEVN